MKKSLISFLATILVAVSVLSASAFSFSDVPSSHEYYSQIKYLETRGLLPENSDDLFQPDKSATPADLYAMLISYADVDIVGQDEVDLPYTDINNDVWYSPYLQTAINLNVLNPPLFNAEFNPNRVIRKRGAIMTLFDALGVGVNKFFDKSDFPFTDLSEDGPSAPYFYKAFNIGLVEENATSAKAAQITTKADLANMLYLIDQSSEGNSVIITVDSINQTQTINNPVFDVFVDVWETIQDEYYYQGEIDEDEMLYEAIDGIVNYLEDPYTTFSSPEDTSAVDVLDSEYEGVGMSVEVLDDEITVITPFKDSPAEEAGIKPNDIIVKVDGINIQGLSLENVVSMIKGTAGTIVEITVKRGTEILNLAVTRGYIIYETVTLEFLEQTGGDIANINMMTFGEDTYNEFLEASREIHDHETTSGNKVIGVILDLRNNPGGYLNTAIDIVGFFFDENKKAVVLEDNKGKKTPYYSKYYGANNEYDIGSGLLADYETVVLVNEGSASASEIVAGALQDYERAKIFGETSFGKGTVQELTFYDDNSIFKLTVSKWLTPDNHDINKKGIVPDRVLENSPTVDWQLDTAIEEFLD
jgi:C-terminal peptidase prc